MEGQEKLFTIEVCSSNQFLDDIETVDWLIKTYPEVAIEPADCLDRCGICIRYAYVVINDDFLYANDVPELKEKIVGYLDSHRAGREDAKK
ncbi:DUF1450 domain-containing protein [Tumebacillus sp. ITR2]|uniref:DUF1450 domain-containing protein n=1 Tax=Tumebacillus amylolyticus TaxID=2801339 RepID=A0ABS1JCI7_9BACL|nr:DUF1450 domain-containing protein [Tumebacillus amylolyticus]MBL0387960.1 DUF1450 domain-containing protein [Tumebacillus amylolyticus]